MKITEKTTNQAVFSFVAKHLLKQNCKSTGHWSCLYHSPDGLKCAVGALISDKDYDHRMERNDIAYLLKDRLKTFPQLRPLLRFLPMLSSLQRVHDTTDPSHWKTNLENVAKDYGLKMPKVV